MTCTNWTLTVLSIAIFVLTFWPDVLGVGATKWVVGVAAVLVLITTWTMVICKPCMNKKK